MSRIQVRTWILTAAMMVAPAVHAGDVVTDWNQKAEAAVLEAKLYPFCGRPDHVACACGHVRCHQFD